MLLNSLLSLTIIILFAFGIHALFNIKSQLTPLISLTVLIDIAILFAMYDMLKPGVIIACGIGLAVFGVSVYANRDSLPEKIGSFLTPGVILFILASTAMLIFMAMRQPMMQEWDEFSFWGISQHLLKIHDQLYTYYKSSMIGNSTPPALPVLSYFFQWRNPGFTEWISFVSYDVMFFACYSAFTALFDRKGWNTAVMVYLFGFLVPYVFEVYTKIIYLEPVYMLTYADIPLGVVFAGALAVYIFTQENDSRSVLSVLPVIMFLTYIKDMGFALSCIVVFIAFFDMWAGRKEYTFLKIRGFFGKCAAAAVMLVTALGSFLSWSMHMARVMERDPFALGGASNMGMVEMLITGVKELLIGPRSEKFTVITELMVDAFLNTQLSFLGSGIRIFAIISALFLIAIVLNDKNGRIRSLFMYITSLIGFVGYYVFHIFLYVYIFKDNAYELVSYNRYIYPYYIGWMCLAVFALCLAVKNGQRFLSKTALFCFSGIILVLFHVYTDYEYLFIGCSERNFATRKNISLKVDYIEDAIGEDDVIYLYSGGDNGRRWFIYTHELAANYIVEDFGVDTTGMTEEEI
ncbi:MAG: hypothetical protein IJD80_06585, partial [Oscillospiraceae bacterium]|nr:hypothetical protein [Oscillospiraceae bacterium]